jgi:hypothetical protein
MHAALLHKFPHTTGGIEKIWHQDNAYFRLTPAKVMVNEKKYVSAAET